MKHVTMKLWHRTIAVKMMKADIDRFERKMSGLIRIQGHVRELTGIMEKPETHRTTNYMIFGGLPSGVAPKDGWREAITAFLDTLPETVTKKEAPGLLEAADKLFEEYVPIKDARETQAEVSTRALQMQRIEDERAAKARAFLDRHAMPGGPTKIQDGWMAVCLCFTVDRSDITTDYFNRHASVGVPLLLRYMPNGAQTEEKARRALSLYPSLEKYQFEWHTENHSGGHGNYLEATVHSEHTSDDGLPVKFEITFHRGPAEFHAYYGAPGEPVDVTESSSTASETMEGGGIQVSRNEEKGGVEVRFPARPSDATISNLKAHGFRWSRFQGLWWARYSEDRMAFAQSLIQGREAA